jgi:hypothetical protein
MAISSREATLNGRSVKARQTPMFSDANVHPLTVSGRFFHTLGANAVGVFFLHSIARFFKTRAV